jgi:hypothetical protein
MRRRFLVFSLAAAASPRALAQPSLQLPPLRLPSPASTATPGVPAPSALPSAGEWPVAAFSAATVEQVAAAFGIPAQLAPSPFLRLDAPEIAFAAQPIEVTIEPRLPGVQHALLLAERLPSPLIGVLQFSAGASQYARLAVHLPRTTRLRLFVQADGWHTTWREVKVAAERG